VDKSNIIVFDIEANNLYLQSTKVWYMRWKTADGSKTLTLRPFQMTKEAVFNEVKNFLEQFDKPLVVGHAILGYDVWVLWKLYGLQPRVGKGGKDTLAGVEVAFWDTFYLSMYLEPDLESHSLDALSRKAGSYKVNYRQSLVDVGAMQGDEPKGFEFSFYHPLMEDYCNQDVDSNIVVFFDLWQKAVEMYGDAWVHPSYRMGQKSFFLMKAQEYTGHGFDKKLALEVKVRLEKEIEDLRSKVEPKLPPRKPNKGEEAGFTLPKNPYKKNGDYSHHMLAFITKHSGVEKSPGVVEFYGKDYTVSSNLVLDVKLPMELKHQDDLKEWLQEEHGWVPTLWNIKKDAKGKAVRDERTKDVIQTSPKLQEMGKLCPNLGRLEGDLAKDVVRFLSLRNRLSILEGWLSVWRLEWDGRLSPKSTKITNTHRQAHSEICNVPRVGSAYGEEFRSMFCAEDGYVIAASDSSGLEQRITGNYTFKYDNGAYAQELLSGDVHSKVACSFFPEETRGFNYLSPDFNKDDPKFKPWRNKAKSGGYAVLYGSSPKKLATVLGKPEKDGKRLYDAFWDSNPALKALKERVELYWSTTGRKKYLPALDGRLLNTRSKHSLVNIIMQSGGAIACDMACCFMDKWLGEMHLDKLGRPYYLYKGYEVKRVVYMHDEYSFECRPEVAEEVRLMAEQGFVKAGEILKTAMPLAGEGKIGHNWLQIH
jgi:hypothetical protein